MKAENLRKIACDVGSVMKKSGQVKAMTYIETIFHDQAKLGKMQCDINFYDIPEYKNFSRDEKFHFKRGFLNELEDKGFKLINTHGDRWLVKW